MAERTITGIDRPPSPQSDSCEQGAKRKLVRETDQPEPPHKRSRVHDAITPSASPEADGPAVRWADYFGQWPRSVEDTNMSAAAGANKRSRSASYSQSVRDGSSPVAWTRQHEEKMREAGLVMLTYAKHAEITPGCRQLCESLLAKRYPLPDGPSFRVERFCEVLDRVQFRNEARVVRDVMPVVVPSPELLHIDGCPGLEHVCEAMNAEWTRCDTLSGPRPKPDFVAGISPSAFSKEEVGKLRMSHTSACPNLFPENMYFPFLICEAKGSDRPLVEAERQAMHSASIAVRALVQLYRKTPSIDSVNHKILVFSVAHDPATVKIFGHYAKVDGDGTCFYRHCLFSGEFAADVTSDRWSKAYQITRAIYELFYPKHVARIKTALSTMPSATAASPPPLFGPDVDSRDLSAELSFQEDSFKRPSLPPTLQLEHENETLRNRLLEVVREQQAESKRQREDQLEQAALQREQLEKQMAQQREQMERQLAQQREQMDRQTAQQLEQMERQMEIQTAQQREQMERQTAQQLEQMERQTVQQREQMERQMAQQRERMEKQMESQTAQQREQTERQMAQQREQMERQTAQQLEQMEKQMALQERQLEQQKEESKEQMAHQKEVMKLLRESMSK